MQVNLHTKLLYCNAIKDKIILVLKILFIILIFGNKITVAIKKSAFFEN